MASSICSRASLSMSHMHRPLQYRSGTTVRGHSHCRKPARSTKPCLAALPFLMLSARCVRLSGTFTSACISNDAFTQGPNAEYSPSNSIKTTLQYGIVLREDWVAAILIHLTRRLLAPGSTGTSGCAAAVIERACRGSVLKCLLPEHLPWQTWSHCPQHHAPTFAKR